MVEKEILDALKRFMDENTEKRHNESRILLSFYKNDADKIVEKIKDRMYKESKGMFGKETLDIIPAWNYINFVPKILNILFTVYKKPAERYISLTDKRDERLTKKWEDLTKNSKLDSTLAEVGKLAKLFDRILVKPTVRINQTNQKVLDIDIIYPHQVEVDTEQNNPKKLKTVYLYDEYYNAEENKMEVRKIIWTDKRHYAIDEHENEIDIIENGVSNNGVNPYGVIPFVPLSFSLNQDCFWGSSKFVQAVEHAIAHSINIIYGSYQANHAVGSIPFFQEFEAYSKPSEPLHNEYLIGTTFNRRPRKQEVKTALSPDKLIVGMSEGQKNADFKMVTPQTNLVLIQEYISNIVKELLAEFNISSNVYSLESKAQSGYAKQIEEEETMAIREQDVPFMRDFENELFDMIRVVTKFDWLEKGFPDEAIFNIDFAEITFPKTSAEYVQENTFDLQNNVITPVDLIKGKNPDLTQDEAEQRYEDNKAFNPQGVTINYGTSAKKGRSKKDEEQMQLEYGKGNDGVSDGVNSNEYVTEKMTNEKGFEFPDLRQASDYDCGAAAVQDVLSYYGDDATGIDSIISELGTDEELGTSPEQIKSYLESQGFTVDMEEMTIEDVKVYIDEKVPVILDIQAWHEDIAIDYDYTNEWNDGHYVVAHKYNDQGLILDDPSSVGRAFISYEDLEKRWHDVNGNNEQIKHLGIAVYGKEPFYKSNLIKVG